MSKDLIKDVKTAKEVQSQLKQDDLTAQEIKFSHLVAQGYTLTKAYKQAFPHKAKLNPSTIRDYSAQLHAKPHILTEVATHKAKQSQLARLAEDRLEQILITDDSDTKGSKVAEVAMFMYDHVNGKATQRVEQTSVGVQLNIDLTGGNITEVEPADLKPEPLDITPS